jgi:predicted type IV restriction endonuclease
MANETVAQAISDIRKTFPNMDGLDNEEDVKQFVIERILNSLGWNLFDPGEIKREFRVGADRPDYILNPGLPTAAFIEAKKVTVNLENHQRQLLNYCFQQAVNLAVLTNGRTWWLYLPRYEGRAEEGRHWSKKRFSEIDITSGGPAKVQREFERFLAKERVASGEAVESAKVKIDEGDSEEVVQKGMIDSWNNTVTTPSEDLIKLLTESTTGLCGVRPTKQKVKEFFQNHRPRFKVSDFGPPQQKPPTNGGTRRQNGKPSFTFNGTPGSARTWKLLLVEFCKLIYVEKQDEFDQIMNVQGRKTMYFSRNPDDLSGPEPIGDSGIFAATAPLSNLGVKQRCQMVSKEFGYTEDFLKI